MPKSKGKSGGKGGGGGSGGGGQTYKKKTGKAALEFNAQKTLRQANANKNVEEDEPIVDTQTRYTDYTEKEEYEEPFVPESMHSSVFSTFNQYLTEQELVKFNRPINVADKSSKFKIVRPMTCLLGVLSNPHGSVKLWQGDTCVVAAFYGPSDIRISKELPHRAAVDVLYRPKITGTSQSQALLHDVNILEERSFETIITNVLETIIYLDDEPAGTGFNVIIHEYENDGCILSASLNASMLAILDASTSIRNTLASVTAIVNNNELIIDPNSEQLKKGFNAMLIFVFSNEKKIVYNRTIGRNVNEKLFKFILDECLKSAQEIFKYYISVMKTKRGVVDEIDETTGMEISEVSSGDDEADPNVEEVTISSGEEDFTRELEDGEIED